MIWIVIFRKRGFTNLVLNACFEPLSLFVCFFFFIKCQTFPFIAIQICICLDRFMCFLITKIFGSSVDYRHHILFQPISKPLGPNDKKSNCYKNDEHHVWNPTRMTSQKMTQYSPSSSPNMKNM